ncbi:hypothetical protein IEQ34_015863 [Dendrobium chrysotoxum]|uniref:Uncharacterized protein n=1 Tax=Dendrobium chrysotoxum TaxID=161865 RepID=A0AAV7GHA5_DENCH|nr:hypothetical protein IEQ34_015863 [Dendrobium chrysotoxum]
MAWESDPEDFSPAATIVPFDPPLPLLRGPVNAGPGDDPSAGSFILAFRDAASWRSAYRATESKIVEQCKAGARAGCSISVSNKCKTPWWKIILGTKQMDFKEREQCEEREMSSCMALAEDACITFAKQKCIPAFQEARIATESSSEVGNAALERVTVEEGSTNYKGSKLMMGSFVDSTS